MNGIKKFLGVTLALVMVLSTSAAALASNDADEEKSEFAKALEKEAEMLLNGEDELDVDIEDLDFYVDPADVVEMAPIDEIVLVDNDSITASVTGYTPMSEEGPAFELSLTNKTDMELCFSLYDVSINGFMIDPLWAERVEPGEQETSEVSWDPKEMAAMGIKRIEGVEGYLWVYDNEDYDADDIFNDTVLWAVESDDAAGPAYEAPKFDFDAKVLLDSDVKVTAVNYDKNAEYGPTITLLVENNSDVPVLVRAENVEVNGTECNPYWFEVLNPGKAIYSPCYWLEDDLEDAKITNINEVAMKLTVVEHDSYEMLESNECSLALK